MKIIYVPYLQKNGKIVCHAMAYTEKASPFASWALVNNKEYNNIIWS